jgi:hypothetical protein
MILPVPKPAGHVARLPQDIHWLLITPQTVADRLDREEKRRERELAEWRAKRARDKAPDITNYLKTCESLAKTNPAGAQQFKADLEALVAYRKYKQETLYPATTARLEKDLANVRAYRDSFTAEELLRPAVWSDPSGEKRRDLDARIARMQELPPAEQHDYDRWTRESRDLERQARALAQSDVVRATQLRTRSREIAQRALDLRDSHRERTAETVQAALSEFELTNIKPGAAEDAIGFKPNRGVAMTALLV